MRFTTFLPCEVLSPYIEVFAISESAESQNYKVLPRTGVVMGFQYKGRLAMVNGENAVSLHTAGVTGLQNTFRIFKNSENIGTILIYFKEGGARSFFKEPIHELYRQSLSLEDFMSASEVANLVEQLSASNDDLARITLVEKFLLSRLKQASPDYLVLHALQLIHESKGKIRVENLAKELNISISPLEKRFRQVVGTSPKKLASTIRFKQIILSYNPTFSLTELAYESGFYDQSHFIKEFKNFTGETPESFFKPK